MSDPAATPAAASEPTPTGATGPVPVARVGVLGSAQLIAAVGVASTIPVGGLLAEEIAGTESFSGLPQTASVLGGALMAVPLARFAGRAGRRPALAAGYSLAAVGAAVALGAAAVSSLILLILGCLMIGAGMAAGLQARFAATDGVADSHRGIVLSIVVWASSIGAILGPNLLQPGATVGRSLGITELGGPWVFGVIALAVGAVIIAVGLRGARPAQAPDRRRIRDTFAQMWAHPDGRLGLVAMATGHAVMVGVMAMTSVHLHGQGSTLRFVGIVISAHVAGMYLLAPLFGWLADRWGPVAVVGLGAGTLLLGCGFTAASGVADARAGDHALAEALATPGLVLIGLGWSAATVAAATLIAVLSHHGEAAPTDIQGVADLTMGLAGASAGVLSGVALAALGYTGLSIAGALLLVPLVASLVAHRRAGRTAASA